MILQLQRQPADVRWVMAYSHKIQSFMKIGSQQKCLDKVLTYTTFMCTVGLKIGKKLKQLLF